MLLLDFNHLQKKKLIDTATNRKLNELKNQVSQNLDNNARLLLDQIEDVFNLFEGSNEPIDDRYVQKVNDSINRLSKLDRESYKSAQPYIKAVKRYI